MEIAGRQQIVRKVSTWLWNGPCSVVSTATEAVSSFHPLMVHRWRFNRVNLVCRLGRKCFAIVIHGSLRGSGRETNGNYLLIRDYYSDNLMVMLHLQDRNWIHASSLAFESQCLALLSFSSFSFCNDCNCVVCVFVCFVLIGVGMLEMSFWFLVCRWNNGAGDGGAGWLGRGRETGRRWKRWRRRRKLGRLKT